MSAISGALRLIAVYAGAAGGTLWLVHRFVRPLARREAPALALLPLLLVGRAILTGGVYAPLNLTYGSEPLAARAGMLPATHAHDGILSDVAILIIPWRKAIRESVRTGHLPLLNRFILCGDPLLGAIQPAVLHPATWIGFLLPLATATTFACALTLLFAVVAMWLFLRDFGLEAEEALFGAAAWMLSNAMTFWVGWPVAPVFAMLPAVAAGLRRIALDRPRGFGLTVSALTLMVLGGHPESMLHVVAAAGVLFLFELVGALRRGRAVARSIAAGALALGLAAVVVLPFQEVLSSAAEAASRRAVYAHQRKSVPIENALSAASAVPWPMSYGFPFEQRPHPPWGFDDVIQGSVGAVALALAMVGLLRSIRREKLALGVLALLSLLVAAGFPFVADVLGRLPLFDIAVNARFAAVTAFALAALAGLGFEALARQRPGAIAAFLGAGGVLVAGGLARMLFLRRGGIDPPEMRAALALAAVSVAGVALVRWRSSLRGFVMLTFPVFLAARLAELPSLYPTYRADLFYPRVAELDALPRGGAPYRVAGWHLSMTPNQSAMFEVEDPRGYTAMTNARLMQTFELWSVRQAVWFNRIDDPNRPFLDLVNLRFLMSAPGASAPPGWRDFVRGPNCSIFENPDALPRAFVPRRVRFLPDETARLEEMSHCKDFQQIAWIEVPGMPAGEIENGPARISVVENGPDLELQIRADKPTWIVVSETNWPGWEARDEKGRKLPVMFADHAFLGVRIPEGRHRVSLRYLPRSVLLGGAVSLGSMGIALALTLRRR